MKITNVECKKVAESISNPNLELYNAITDYAEKYGAHKFNDDENHAEYMKLVDICVKCGLIPECNREEFSTHGRLSAAIAYESNRIMFCQ